MFGQHPNNLQSNNITSTSRIVGMTAHAQEQHGSDLEKLEQHHGHLLPHLTFQFMTVTLH